MSNYEDPKKRVTLSGRPPAPGYEDGSHGAPAPIDPKTGMHQDYWVLPEEEIKKGYVRPFRDRYKHVGIRPKFPTRELTEHEHKIYDKFSYVLYEEYPPEYTGHGNGRYWTEKQLKSGCGGVTNMGHALSATYARDPTYYGSTFCTGCGGHHRVEEFIWTADGQVVGS